MAGSTELAQLLHALRMHAGAPSVTEIGEQAGVSRTLVGNLLNNAAFVSWDSVCKVITVLGGDPEDFRGAWERAERGGSPDPAGRMLAELRVLQLQARLSEQRLVAFLDQLTPEMLAAGLIPGLPPLSKYVTGVDHGRPSVWHDAPGCEARGVFKDGAEFIGWIVRHHREAHGDGA